MLFPGGTTVVPADTDFSDLSTLKLNLSVVSILVRKFFLKFQRLEFMDRRTPSYTLKVMSIKIYLLVD